VIKVLFLKHLFLKNDIETIDLFQQRQRYFGPFNKDKFLYLIEENNNNLGFFAMYRYWVEYLYFADICGYTPVILAGNGFNYREKDRVCGTKNPFEYYFNQPTSIGVRETKISSRVILSSQVHREMVELIFTGKRSHYQYNQRYLSIMGHIVKKYIRYNSYTQNYIDEGLKKLEIRNKRVLGVHIRGTDFRRKYDNHPVYVNEEDCFMHIDRIMGSSNYDHIFIATDDQRILSKFIRKYGKQLYFYEDTERSNTNQSVAFSSSNRNNHKYLLGLEVIRDMHTLSLCDGLVAGISQVAVCAQINKLSRGEKYQDIKIIDKGLYRNSHIFTRYH